MSVEALDGLPVDLTDLSGEDRDFFRAIAMNAGEATTSELRETSGLKRSQIHYRENKFEDLGMIAVDRTDTGGPANEPNTIRLTDTGDQLVDSGALEDIDDPNATLESISRQLDNLADRVAAVERNVATEQWRAFTEEQYDAIRVYLKDHLGVDEPRELRDDLDDLRRDVDQLKDGSADGAESVDETEHPDPLWSYISDIDVAIYDIENELGGEGEELERRREAFLACLQYVKEHGEASVYTLQDEVMPEHPTGIDESSWFKHMIGKAFGKISRESPVWEFDRVNVKLYYHGDDGAKN